MFGIIVFVSIFLSMVLGGLLLNASDTVFWVVQIVYSLLLGATAVVYTAVKQKPIVDTLELNKAPKLVETLVLIVCTAVLIFAMIPINNWFCQWLIDMGLNLDSGLTDEMITNNLAFAIVATCIVAPITEELVFRGVIAKGLISTESTASKVLGILLSGFLFSIFHMSAASTLHQFVFGCLLGYFYIQGKSIWVSIIGHAFNNSFVLLLSFVLPEDFFAKNGVWLAIGGVVLLAVIIYLYTLFKAKNSAEKSKKINLGADFDSDLDAEYQRILEKEQQEKENKAQQTPSTGGIGSLMFLTFGILVCMFIWIASLFLVV